MLGIVAGFFTLFVGGIGSAFEAKEADSILNLAWVGIAAAMLVVIGGGVSLARPRGGGMVAVFASVVGIVYGGSLVAICLVLGLIGGSLAVLARPKAGELDEAEPARKRWQALGMSLGVGITVLVIAIVIEQNGNASGSGANPESNAAKTSWPSMAMGQTASENRSAVLPAQPVPSDPSGLGIYRLGGSTLEFAPQPDGALSFKLLIVSDSCDSSHRQDKATIPVVTPYQTDLVNPNEVIMKFELEVIDIPNSHYGRPNTCSRPVARFWCLTKPKLYSMTVSAISA